MPTYTVKPAGTDYNDWNILYGSSAHDALANSGELNHQLYSSESEFDPKTVTAYGSLVSAIPSPGAATINSVTVTLSGGEHTDPGTSTVRLKGGFRIGGVNYAGCNISIDEPSSPATQSVVFTTNPVTGLAWTPAEVTGLGWWCIGTEARHSGDLIKAYKLWFDVDYVATLAPTAPTSLNGALASITSISLTWVDNSSNETSFRIERCTGSGCGGFVEVANVGPNISSYTDSGLAPATTYRYRVRARNAAGDSAYTNIIEITLTGSPWCTVAAPIMVGSGRVLNPTMPKNTIAVDSPMTGSGFMFLPMGLDSSRSDPLVGHGRLGFRDNMRTYRDLIEDKSALRSSKVEAFLGSEIPPAGWVLADPSSGTYAINPYSVVVDFVQRDIVGVEMGIAPYSLTRVDTFQQCYATPGTYHYERLIKTLYVHLIDNVNPATTTMVALLGFYWSTQSEIHPTLGTNKLNNPGLDWSS